MLKRLLLAVIFACGLAVPAWSQSNVIVNYKNGTTGPGTQVTPSTPLPIFSGFTQTGRPSDLSVTNTTGSEALGATGQVVRACNIGSNTAYVALGDSTVTATATGSIPVLAGTCASLNIGTATYIAAITSASTTTLQISVGYGVAALGGGGGVGYTPSGAAGGDLTGNYPNPTIKSSVGLTGFPTAPTVSNFTDSTTKIATTAFVQSVVSLASLTTVGALASGSIASGFGNIVTSNAIQGSTISGGIAAVAAASATANIFSLTGILFTGTNGLAAGNTYYNSGWKFVGNGSAGAISLGTNSTTAMTFLYDSNNSGGAGAAGNVRTAGLIDTSGGWTFSNAVYMTGLTSGSGASALCLNATGSQVESDTSSTICGISALRYKNLIAEITPDQGLRGILSLHGQSYTYKKDAPGHENDDIVHVSLIADDMAAMNHSCAEYSKNGVENYMDRCFEAYQVGYDRKLWDVVSQLRHELDVLKNIH